MTWVVEIASATVAGLVIVVVSALVERLGPVIGAVLGSVPHVAVVGSVGFFLQTASSDEFRIAMLSMPLGMLCNSLFTMAISISARLLPQHCIQSPKGRLFFCVACGFLSYVSGLAAIMFGLRPKEQSMQVAWLAAAAAFVLELLVGILLVCVAPSTSKSGPKPRTSFSILVARGLVTFCIFFGAVAVARSLPALAGILANLPLVTTMILVVIWTSQGEDVTLGCLGPMTLGMLSASGYSMLSSELMLLWHPVLGCVVSWLLSLVVVTKPTLVVLEQLNKQKERKDKSKGYDPEAIRTSEGSSSAEGSTSSSC
ncbi:Uncharacterized protein SCF082_LOCUS1538 [Durusdinium trenchii]|uniref:Transmembrane protein n=1 Tax=Durusdinium trenchii TaxID=1381693 RepID=A0ABP0HGC7_9DINO